MKVAVLLVLSMVIALAVPVAAMPSIDGEYTVDGEWPVPGRISPEDRGPWVAELQLALNDAGFRAGEPDGYFGRSTLGAVYAFQKVHDLPRDGVFLREHWDLLDEPLVVPGDAPEDTRVEVDLGRQVLYLIEKDAVSFVLPISSASGDAYRSFSGSVVRANTPEGSYEFYKKVDGWRISYLGGLYRPFYFSGGYAIHGSGSVPPYPASHGCIRVEMWDMDFLAPRLELGMPVYVYGARNERSNIVPAPPLTVDEMAAQRLAVGVRGFLPG
jgi:peptidoglycan hydrolase-like protein with peptidoglycan-binding domain